MKRVNPSIARQLLLTTCITLLAGCAAQHEEADESVVEPVSNGQSVSSESAASGPAVSPAVIAVPEMHVDATAATGSQSSLEHEAKVSHDAIVMGPASMVLPKARNALRYELYPPGQRQNTENYQNLQDNPVRLAAEEPVSTFSIDVDTGAYANVRRFLNAGQLPPEDAVRVEEMLNYFDYDYPEPASRAQPFRVSTELAPTPWNADSQLLRIGIKGYSVAASERPAANLVFLVDVSGSMHSPDKLPLLQNAFRLLSQWR